MRFELFEKLPKDKRERILSTGIRAFSEKPYREVSTDAITRECRISKGILFHYFGSKKAFYLYCLAQAMSRLTEKTEEAEGGTFYEILFSEMERKTEQCRKYRDEMRMVNMAGRDASLEIQEEKNAVFRNYAALMHAESFRVIERALKTMNLNFAGDQKILTEGMYLYVHALISRYLKQYQSDPDAFFAKENSIRKEMKQYLDLFLYGIMERMNA